MDAKSKRKAVGIAISGFLRANRSILDVEDLESIAEAALWKAEEAAGHELEAGWAVNIMRRAILGEFRRVETKRRDYEKGVRVRFVSLQGLEESLGDGERISLRALEWGGRQPWKIAAMKEEVRLLRQTVDTFRGTGRRILTRMLDGMEGKAAAALEGRSGALASKYKGELIKRFISKILFT